MQLYLWEAFDTNGEPAGVGAVYASDCDAALEEALSSVAESESRPQADFLINVGLPQYMRALAQQIELSL